MRKLKPNDVRHLGARDLRNRALRAIDTINDLRWIADNAEHIARLVNDNIDDALRGRSYDGDKIPTALTHVLADLHAGRARR